MAVVYFTSNASTGAGSLVEAVKNARPGDVVRPDESVFERGSTIEIALTSQLTVNRNLTFDASPFRVRLVANGTFRALGTASNVTAEVKRFDFVGGATNVGGGIYVGANSELVLDACLIAGCGAATAGGGLFVPSGSRAILRNSLVIGCRAPQGGGISASGFVTVDGVTIIGNAGNNGADFYAPLSGGLTATNSIIGRVVSQAPTVPKYVGSVVGVASSAVGFVASPPDDLTPENWNVNLWQDWDLRLLDDASPKPSPYRDSGDVGEMSQYDLQGNFRGRKTNGVATCSPGAYETLQADLFWIGRDATGAEVVSPSFLTSDGWAASRFATVSGDVAPQAGQTLFVDGVVVFSDDLPTFSESVASVVVGGFAKVDFNAANAVGLALFSVGYGSLTTAKTRLEKSYSAARVAAWARLTGQIVASIPCEFDANAYIASGYFYNSFVSPSPTYGALVVAPSTSVRVRLEGVYSCDSFRTTAEGTSPSRTIKIGDAATIRARSVSFLASADVPFETLFDKRVAIELQDAASATVGDGAPASWADAFEIDVSDATASNLKLNGQTVYGDAPTCAVALTGSAKIDERGLDVESLTLNADATLTVDGARVVVAELNVADGANVAFSSVDAILTATETATVGAASFAETGYFATPQGTDLTAATFAETVRVSDFGAGVADFTATATGPTTAKLEWRATDETARVCVERENAAAPNGWETLTIAPTAEASPLSVALSGRERFRVFDGATFSVDSAWSSMFGQQFVVLSSYFRVANEKRTWEAKTKVISNTLNVKAGQSVTILARISDAFDAEALLLNDGTNIISVSYSALKKTGSLSSNETPIDGHVNVAVPTTCVLEAPLTSDAWGEKYNFILTPNIREKPIFPTTGNYSIKIEIVLADGNPITFYVEIEVS